MRIYRLVKARYRSSALDGSGAKTYGGRWNPRGLAAVYASDSISLAALELLVHLHRSDVLNHYLLVTLDVPDEALLVLDDTQLPADWREDPAPASTAAIGMVWLQEQSSLALAVPSVLVPQQRNVLLNPAHPAFAEVARHAAFEAFKFDARLAG
ncbi:RES family NAD+ phosphorylase [Thiorhodococcus minor]|uniref:RES domain-containing protein n=1 Tax=Thiorhodococcus minor TaxID=57489 RepID=A0A6M0K5T7_9GAMM|nr:RES family NAD+ phosphorylase [Thiorhodococcus minor]NEV64303.1 RES domain-containing protein [Thiorhodococcus minor]